MSRFAILRIGKVKSMAEVARIQKHMERERETPNADPDLEHLNERLAGTGDWVADVQARLSTVPKIRANAVLGIEHVLTASPEWFSAGSLQEQDQRRDRWRDVSMTWLRETYGADNLVAAVMHRDESGAPHIQALVVPIDERGKLNARLFVGGDRYQLSKLQDSYAAKVEPLGLERGIRGSVATHQEVKHWYAQIQQPAREIEREIAAAVKIEVPEVVVARPQEYAQRQRERVLSAVTPQVGALAQKAEYLSHRVERQELQIAALSQREIENQALLGHLRQVNLGTVITALGGERDAQRASVWRLGGEVISVTGDRFYNQTRQRGGRGAIELLHAQLGYTHNEAIAYLRDNLGTDVAVVAAARHAQTIAEREPAAPFRAPQPDSQRWPQVRTYLTEQRGLPSQFIDYLHDRGTIYADRAGSAVFVRQNDQGEVTGAYLQGTSLEKSFLAPGTRRDAGYFRITLSATQNARHEPPTLIIAETPVEAISVFEIKRRQFESREHGPLTVLSLDGAATFPQQHVRETLEKGGVVHLATKHDQVREQVYQEFREKYPNQMRLERPAGEDWNDTLRRSDRWTRDPKKADRELHAMWRQHELPQRSTPRAPQYDRRGDRGYER